MRRRGLFYICCAFVLLSLVFGSRLLDVDEFSFVKEPYELFGGDYTIGYLKQRDVGAAIKCMAKSYYFYWQYRPLFSPIIPDRHKTLFQKEEDKFGYVKPGKVEQKSLDVYKQRMIVPEPDRFYQHGAGKPLLPALTQIPSLALAKLVTLAGPDLLDLQFTTNYHPLFIILRLPGILAGLACIILVYKIVRRDHSEDRALFAASLAAFFPTSLFYFPNIHHDSVMTPFVLASSYYFVKERYKLSGIFFGLAMASKNTAVLMLPVALVFVAIESVVSYRQTGHFDLRDTLRTRGRGLLLFVLVGLVFLTPFANPVSEFREILTPVIGREYDPRGEDVSSFVLNPGFAGDGATTMEGTNRPGLNAVKNMVGYGAPLFFVVLGLAFAVQAAHSPLTRFCLLFLLLTFPYRLIFGGGLAYR
ncbi:MAG: glycosyltransferase family 39 protein, partial [Candidatus Latescibacterota bacterium]